MPALPDLTPGDLTPEELLIHFEWIVGSGGQGTTRHRLLRDEVLRRLRLVPLCDREQE